MTTEFPFTLPQGYIDREGQVHRDGVMRLATAYDEIAPMKDPRVQSNSAYLVIILLSRVIDRLGELEHVNPKIIEELYAGDLAYLQDLYLRLNGNGHNRMTVRCPHCDESYAVDVDPAAGPERDAVVSEGSTHEEIAALGRSPATPLQDSSRR